MGKEEKVNLKYQDSMSTESSSEVVKRKKVIR